MEIVYHHSVVEVDIPKLDKAIRARVRRAIETKIALEPTLYGLPLRGTLHKFWKLRVGDYRIVYTVEKATIRILLIAHRSEVYSLAGGRK